MREVCRCSWRSCFLLTATFATGSAAASFPAPRRVVLRPGFFRLAAGVEGVEVPAAFLGEDVVALLHLVDDPAQGQERLLGIGHDRQDEVRQVLVALHFHDLGVDHDEAQLVRREAAEQAGDDAVDADGFSAAGRAGDEQVRHRGEVGDDGFAVDVLAEGERDFRLAVLEGVVLEQFADGHDDPVRSWAVRCRRCPCRGWGRGC